MKEYKEVIDYYSVEGAGWFSKTISGKDWGDYAQGEQYLDKYWLTSSEYNSKWKTLQDSIFVNNVSFPELIFPKPFKLLVLEGGCLFFKQDFLKLQNCMLALGESHFVVIEDDNSKSLAEPALRFRFPTTISWDELTSGKFVSSTLIESIHKEFFVFGDSGLWGKFSATDFDFPLDLYGVDPKCSWKFDEQLPLDKSTFEKIRDYIPLVYNDFINKR